MRCQNRGKGSLTGREMQYGAQNCYEKRRNESTMWEESDTREFYK